MIEKHKCKLYLRSFANGRALGGHMRTHTPNQIENSQNQEQPVIENEDMDSIPSSSLSESREKPPMADLSETDSPKDSIIIQDRIIQISETNPDEEVAYCLMTLKRDSWRRKDKEDIVPSSSTVQERRQSKLKVKFKCETCGKAFKSYQALGGHRASHKKGSIANTRIVEKEKNNHHHHQCPICFKVFSSGQALGGHKRSHLSSRLEASSNLVDSPVKRIKTLIDLNLPPPSDEDDDNEITHVELSVISQS